MSEQVVADPVEFARGRKCFEGEIALSRLTGLQECLASVAGSIHFKLGGFVNENADPGLRCEIHGVLQLQCQRCLEPMDYGLHIDSLLLLVHAEQVLAEDHPETPDTIPIQRDLSVAALVEEEILLALPMAPQHTEGVCRGLPAADTGKLRPFAALARLKTNQE